MNITRKIPISILFNIFLVIALFIMSLEFSQFTSLQTDVLLVPLIFTFIIYLYLLITNFKFYINKSILIITLIFCVFFTYYLINIDVFSEIDLRYILYMVIICFVFISMTLFGIKIIVFPLWMLAIFIYSSIFFFTGVLHLKLNFSNSSGILAFLFLFFCFSAAKKISNNFFKLINIITVLLNLIIIFLAESRTAILASCVTLLVYLFWSRTKKHYKKIVAAIVFLSIGFVFIYLKLFYSNLGIIINNFFINYTGKNFFSGRQIAWESAIKEVINSEHFLTGMGHNSEFEMMNGYVHNLYVQVFYQTGFIGIVLIVVLLLSFSFLLKRANSPNEYNLRVTASFFIGILIIQNFEGLLIYNISVISLLSWIIIGLLINYSSTHLAKKIKR
jgi:hypothetical protein